MPEQKQKAKGNPSWRPALQLDVPNKEKGFRYRWRWKDPENLQRAQIEGWDFVQKPTGHTAPAIDGAMIVDETGRLKTSLTEYRELILMRMPEELAQSRDQYFQEKTDAQLITPSNYKNRARRMFAEAEVDSSTMFDNRVTEID